MPFAGCSIYPYAFRWLLHIDDMSGIDGSWDDIDAPFDPVIGRLLRVVGEVYLPFLLANAAALAAGEETFAMTAMGLPYRQSVFKYQVKCLAELRARYAALDAAARGRIDPLLDETNIIKAL